MLLKVAPGSDEFTTEKYAAQIAEVLATWSERLLRSSRDMQAVEQVLSPDFLGAPLEPSVSRPLRSGILKVYEKMFAGQPSLRPSDFVSQLGAEVSSLGKILSAEFQVTAIEAGQGRSTALPAVASGEEAVSGHDPGAAPAPAELRTRVRYELVGEGEHFYREQRVGEWDLRWQGTAAGNFLIKHWQPVTEIQSRTSEPIFADVTASALVGTPSYSTQLLHGADYWRTVLDGACGIDVYGHNGIAIGDIDGDGFDDLYVCQAAGLPNRLYRNRGDRTFEDVTEASGVGLLENTACALFADFDHDGRQDLLVVRNSGPVLFLNQGGGKFRQKANAFQFARAPQGTFTGAAAADYDRDGWLDVYFCLYLYYQGAGQYKYPVPYYDAQNGPPNFLMRNQRDGTFRDVTTESGLNQNNTRYSFCCGWSDYDRDGWPDLYVVNDFGRKNLYRNNGDGTFTDVALPAGVEDVGAGMSVCWLDYDNDGTQDLYVANMWTAAGNRIAAQKVFQSDAPDKVRALYRKHAMGNSLFRNIGSRNVQSTFEDVSQTAGAGNGRWSWSSDAWDFDHDGFPDLYVTNGMVSGPSREELNSFFWRQVVAKSPSQAGAKHGYEQGWSALNELLRSDGTWSGYERNVFYANNGDGTFADVAGAAGLDFVEDGRAFALADFDHDGRVEVFLKNRNGPQLRILKNVMKDLPPSIAFRLKGTGKSNPDAIGAEITLRTTKGRQSRMLQAGSGFLSQHSKEVFFGLGDAKGPVGASIRWPSGLVESIPDVPPDHRIWVEEGVGVTRMERFVPGPRLQPPVHGNSTSEAASARPATGKSAQAGEALPVSVETWLLAPVVAPDFSLADLAGREHSLSAIRGKPVLLNFWTSASPVYRADLEMFSSVDQRWREQGLQLLAVNVDTSSDGEQAAAWVRERRFPFPVLRGTDDVAAVYNILYRYLFDRHRDMTLPASFLINAEGEVVKLYQGHVNADHVERDLHQTPRTSRERLAKALPFAGVIDDPEFRRNFLSLGSVFFQRGYMEPAEASFRAALRDDPASAEALYGLGSVYLNQQRTKEARESFERVTKLEASYPQTLPDAWNNLGLLAAQEGRMAEAISSFQEALRLSPDHVIALKNLGNAYRRQKRWDEARTTLERAVAADPQDAEASYSLGMVFAQLDDTEHAYEYLQGALSLRPGYPEALNNLGILYLRTRRRDQAVASFEECIRVAPEFDQAYLNLARVHIVEGATDLARSVLQKLLAQRPEHAQARQMLEELGK